jgi:hypothetical protein
LLRKKINEQCLLFLAVCFFSAGLQGQNRSTGNAAAAQNAEIAKTTGIVQHESLNSLALAPGQLTAMQTISGEKVESATFTRELVQVQWRFNDPIDLYVIRPKGISSPHVVLYLYSYPTETTRFRSEGYCQRITSGGVAAIGFVSAMTGQRYHDRPMKEWFVSELPESLTISVHDVQMVLDYLKKRGDFDLSDVGIFGQGSGGTIAILSASVDMRIRAIDVLDPWGDWPGWLANSSLVPDSERSTYLKPKFLASIAPLDPVNYLPKLARQAVRLQYRSDDSVTPLEVAANIASAAPPNARVVHYASGKEMYMQTSEGRIFDWIKDQIRGGKASSYSSHGQSDATGHNSQQLRP